MPVINLTIKNHFVGAFKKTVKKSIDMPETWDELSADQLLRMIPIIAVEQDETNTLFALQVLLGEDFNWLNKVQIKGLMKHVKWLWNSTFDHPVFSSFKIKPRYRFYLKNGEWKHFKIPFSSQRLVMPGKFFYNVKMGELAFGMAYLSAYFRDKRIAQLDMAIGIFCRPAKKKWKPNQVNNKSDEREELNPDQCMFRSKNGIDQLDPTLKTSILMFLMGCMKTITNNPDYAPIFNEPKKANEGEEENEELEEEKEINIWSWKDFARSCTKIDLLGKTMENVNDQYVHDVFLECSKAIIEQKEREKEWEIKKAQMAAKR